MDIFTRTEILIGKGSMEKLQNANVLVFGIGGVGSFCIEALARAGINNLHIVDDDIISITNLNRQVIALHSTIGMDKIEVMKNRLLDINKDINVTTTKMYYTKKTCHLIDFSKYDYIIDAIDSIANKVLIAEEAKKTNTPVISSMGTGNKLDPSLFFIDDVFNTSVCPVCRIMRNELRKKGIDKLDVVYSKEKPTKPAKLENKGKSTSPFRDTTNRLETPGSISFVPPVSGFILASYVVKKIIEK